MIVALCLAGAAGLAAALSCYVAFRLTAAAGSGVFIRPVSQTRKEPPTMLELSRRFVCWNCEQIKGPEGALFAEAQLCTDCKDAKAGTVRRMATPVVAVLVSDDAAEGP